jgi:putative acetyltransferase
MQLQSGVFPILAEDYPRVVDVWEASVRATHHFVSEADIQFFRPLVRDALPQIAECACVRDLAGQVAGFIAVAERKVEMLFMHPNWRGQGAGGRLLRYAVETFGATTLDVNEQNEQALGFYLRQGFEIVGRSELDGTGKPYPLLHLRLSGSERCSIWYTGTDTRSPGSVHDSV